MINLDDSYIVKIDRASSKGNQLKWFDGSFWYKADNNGYEGLSEYVVSKLLRKSSLNKSEFVDYDLDQVKYKNLTLNACKSRNFLSEGTEIITLQRLFDSFSPVSLIDSLNELVTTKQKVQYIVNNVISYTGLVDFGEYLYKLFVLDALFLNEDRHTHNIAVLKNKDNSFDYCPIFDNGACLLSDTRLEYPLNKDINNMIKQVVPKLFDGSFMDVIDDITGLYDTNISFSYNNNDIDSIIDDVSIYDENIKNRVRHILKYQKNKLNYFFE